MSLSFNHIVLQGWITKEPILLSGGKTPLTRPNISSPVYWYDRQESKQHRNDCCVDFLIWGKSAQRFVNMVDMGDVVLVSGTLHLDQWLDKDTGKKRYTHFIRVRHWAHIMTKEVFYEHVIKTRARLEDTGQEDFRADYEEELKKPRHRPKKARKGTIGDIS